MTLKKYHSLEETYLMALCCVKDQKKVFNSLTECRNEEKYDPYAVMIDFVETEENDIFTFTAHDLNGGLYYIWERK